MKSIPTIFLRDKATRQVKNEKLQMVRWVFEGKGTPTRKYDGVGIKVDGGKVWRRFEWAEGESIPSGFVRCQDPDPKRPHAAIPGWVPVPDTFKTAPKGKDERYLKEAWDAGVAALNAAQLKPKETKVVNQYAPAPVAHTIDSLPNGTYELCGPDIHGNHDRFKGHVLLLHGSTVEKKVPRDFEGLKAFLETYEGEGIVWHYKNGDTVQMAKIKRRDFGFMVRLSKEDKEMAYREPIVTTVPYTPVHMSPVDQIPVVVVPLPAEDSVKDAAEEILAKL